MHLHTHTYRRHIRTIVQRLTSHGLVINVSKCQFGATTIDYLGHWITKHGVVSLSEKVEAIRMFTRPKSVKGLQQFAGMVNFYQWFIPKCSSHQKELLHMSLTDKPIALSVDASGELLRFAPFSGNILDSKTSPYRTEVQCG